jgi:hypothetical protein
MRVTAPTRLALASIIFQCATAWYIAPPRVASEWTKLSQLIVDMFDAPLKEALGLEQDRCWFFDKEVTERATYRQYVSTAKK